MPKLVEVAVDDVVWCIVELAEEKCCDLVLDVSALGSFVVHVNYCEGDALVLRLVAWWVLAGDVDCECMPGPILLCV